MVGWKDGEYWPRTRRPLAETADAGRWTLADTASVIVALLIRWEVAAAFVALKLWQQASGYRGSTFAFAREKWEALVAATRTLLPNGAVTTLHVAPRPGADASFERWRRGELVRIEGERDRLRSSERELAAYRDELLHARSREDFERHAPSRGYDAEGRSGAQP